MQNASTRASHYSKTASAQLLQDILTFNQQEQSPMTFAQRYITVAAEADRIVSTIASSHPDTSEEIQISLFESDILHMTNQMLDLIEAQLLMGLNHLQWAKYEASRGKEGIGLALKEDALSRGMIQQNVETLLGAIDSLDPVAIFLKRVCPNPSMTPYHSLVNHIEDAACEYSSNPWGRCLLGQVLLGYKDKAKREAASECFLHAVLLLPSCPSRAQKVILLKSVSRYCTF